MRRYSIIAFFYFLAISSFGQTLKIVDIQYIGLQRTKAATLNKVLQFDLSNLEIEASDSSSFLNQATKTLYNTKLFSTVSYRFKLINNEGLALKFIVKERWYSYGMPYVDLIDRNFNEWWVTRGHSLDRIIIGADFTQKNLRGRNDDLSISFLSGFQKRLEIGYMLPQYYKNGKLGFSANFNYNNYKSVNYNTLENQLQYIQSEFAQFTSFSGDIGILFNPDFNHRFWINAGVFSNKIGNELADANSHFLFENIHSLTYTQLNVGGRIDSRDLRGYAQKGSLYYFELKHVGFIQNFSKSFMQLDLRWTRHIPFGQKTDLALSTNAKVSRNKERPYLLNRGLGWGINAVRCYDYYSIEGHSFFLQKASVRYRMVDKIFQKPKIPINQFKTIPFKAVPKVFFDLGYVLNANYLEQGNFANRPLYGYGFGLDLVFFDDAVWRFEYGLNHLGKAAFFLNFTSAIQ